MNLSRERLSLGNTVLTTNEKKGHPIITGNYVGPDHRLPLPGTLGDWYLRQTFVPAVEEGETVICHTLIDGLLEYYKAIGLLPDSSQVIEVEPQIGNGVLYSFPATDPLEILRDQVHIENDDPSVSPFLAPTFTGTEVQEQAQVLGLILPERAPSSKTNNKTALRAAMEQYHFHMLPGNIVGDWDEINYIVRQDWNTSCGSWLKFPTGSGGDLVYRINGYASQETLVQGRENLRNAVKQSFRDAQFPTSFEEFWPAEQFSPIGFPLVIEADASKEGEILINGSTQFITHSSGNVELIGHFSQITTEVGEYLGNEPYDVPNSTISDLIEAEIQKVAKYNTEQNHYFGIQGVDWFLIRQQNGQYTVRVVELNSRPTANTPPVIMAEKLGANHWVNTNVYTDKPIEKLSDFVELVGVDLAYGNAQVNGQVVPQSFRTLVTRQQIHASPNFKVVIAGRDAQHCRDIMQKLREKGIRFSS